MNSRIISGTIALIYISAASLSGGFGLAWQVVAFLILPLACIWFSEAMGDYASVGLGRAGITRKTPGCFVAFGGWLLLLLPVIVGVIGFISGNN